MEKPGIEPATPDLQDIRVSPTPLRLGFEAINNARGEIKTDLQAPVVKHTDGLMNDSAG